MPAEPRDDIGLVAIRPAIAPTEVVAALGEVIDPELGLDVVSLGLVYEVHVVGDAVTVSMTLTTPGCPLHGTLRREATGRLEALEGCAHVDVQLVWDPPWGPERISEAGRAQLFGG